MSLAAYRARSGLTLQQLAEVLDLSVNSAGHLSRIEKGAPAGFELALKVDDVSAGEVPAETLLSTKDGDLLRRVFARRAARSAELAGAAA